MFVLWNVLLTNYMLEMPFESTPPPPIPKNEDPIRGTKHLYVPA